jgi:hypothetical protein
VHEKMYPPGSFDSAPLSAVARDKSVTRSAQDDDSVGILTAQDDDFVGA